MTDINKLIEEETTAYAERIKQNTRFTSNECIAARAAFKRGASIISDIILHHNRWRKVSEELPEMGQLIAVKYKMAQCYDDKYTVYEIDSSRMFELLKEYGDEWKPIE